MSAKIDMLSFEMGIVDPLVEVRATATNHGRGARRMENMIPLAQGPAISRPPSRYIAATKASGKARLFKVVYSDVYAYLVEFGDGYCRFFTNAGQIVSGGAAYEITSPYAAADLDNIQGWNDAGTLYLTDGNHTPYRLVYSSSASWTLEAIPFTWGPFRDTNDSDITITPSGTTGTITLTAAGGTPFLTGATGHIGAKFLVGHRMSESSLVHKFTANGTSATISVPMGAGWKITTSGTWDGTLYVEKTYDGGVNQEIAATYSPEEDTNFQDTGDETFDDAVYRLRFADWSKGKVKVTFVVLAHVAYGYATITAVTSTTIATAEVVEPLAATAATKIWAFGAWCPAFGYPRGVGCVDNRLSLIGSTQDPTTQWLTRPNKYTEMRTDTTAASALTFAFTTNKGDPFLWLIAEQDEYYLGTPSAVLQIAAADPTSAISPENKPAIKRRIEFGSSTCPPVRAHASLVLMDGSRLRPMKITYDWEQDLLFSPPLNFECPTITEPGIKKVVFQRGRVPMLWLLRDDGWVLGVPFEQLWRQEIIGWSEHWTGGTDAVIEDIEVLPSTAGDVLWWIVSRTIGGATVRTVEKLDAIDLVPIRATAHHLDSYVLFEGAVETAISGLSVNSTTGVITVTALAHGIGNSENIDFADVGGMTWLNSRIFIASDVTTNTFTVKTLAGVYVDGRVLTAYTTGGTVRQVENRFSGLDHLEGQSVYAVGDGAASGPYTVTNGMIALSRGYYNRVAVGLFVDGWLQPLRLAIPLSDGSGRARQQNVTGLWVSLYRSWDLEYGPDSTDLHKLAVFDMDAPVGTPPELVTRDVFVPVVGGLTMDPTILIHRNTPLPLCVRGLMLDTAIGGQKGGR